MDEGRDTSAAPAAGDGGSPAADEEARLRAVFDELRRLKVEDLARDMMVSLVTVGYQKLGLTEQTRELRDLGGARLAIELLRAGLDVLEREGGVAGLGGLRDTLAAMQLNYARAVAEAPAEGAASPSKGAAPPDEAAEASAESAEAEPPAGGAGTAPDEPPA